MIGMLLTLIGKSIGNSLGTSGDMRMKAVSDGTTASYYELPRGATELYHLIIHKNMNAQLGEIFRAAYRYGETSHSDQLRDIRKIKTYAAQEEERLLNEKAEQQSIDWKAMSREADTRIEQLTRAMESYLART